MYSKLKILGHPIHPMLIAYPIAFYTATLGGFILYHFTADHFWFKAAVAANIAGIIAAVVAAVPGFVDWFTGVPETSPARQHGLIHLLLNAGAFLLFVINAIIHTGHWDTPAYAGWGAFFALIGVVLTIAAGFFGWTMIQNDHVGVNMGTAEPRVPDTAAL